jgi:hypothetical protein
MYFSWLFCPSSAFLSGFSVESAGFCKTSKIAAFQKCFVALKQEIFDI